MSFLDWFRSRREEREPDFRGSRPEYSGFEERLDRLLDEVAAPSNTGAAPTRADEVAGTVELRQGQVIVTDPVGRGLFPTIAPGPGIVIFVNGKAIEGPTVVTSRCKVEVYAPPRPPACRMTVHLSESKLEADLTVERTRGQEYSINDAAPSPRLTVTATVSRETEPDPVTVEAALRFLGDEGVSYGIDSGALMEVLEQGGTATVARGDPPVPGEHAHVEYYFPDSEFVARAVGQDDLRVDLLERNELVSVVEGAVLARKFPARPGVPGTTVTGQPLAAPPVEDVTIRAGPGVELLDDGLVAVATRQGRPLLKNNELSVLPVFVVDHDADAETGHLSFNGHLLIKGSVHPGIKVRASGDVKLLGGAEQASIIAGGNVDVRGNIIGCTIRAGGLDALGSSTLLRLEELALELESLVKSIHELKSHPSFRAVGAGLEDDGPLVRLLLDKKFQAIPQLLTTILEPGNHPTDEETLGFLEACAQRYVGLGPVNIQSVVEVAADLQALKRLINVSKENIRAPAHLYASYAQNSTLEASGPIWVIGDGCYNCELRAGAEVRIDGRAGLFRGGSITSGGDVHVKWLGAPSGSPTRVNFLPGKRVTAEEVEPNVVLKTGRQAATIDDRGRLLEAYLDQRGLLQIIKLKGEWTEQRHDAG